MSPRHLIFSFEFSDLTTPLNYPKTIMAISDTHWWLISLILIMMIMMITRESCWCTHCSIVVQKLTPIWSTGYRYIEHLSKIITWTWTLPKWAKKCRNHPGECLHTHTQSPITRNFPFGDAYTHLNPSLPSSFLGAIKTPHPHPLL